MVADDGHSLGVFSLLSDAPDEHREIFPGELPEDPLARKREKPDFEALFELTGIRGDRALVVVPSGSKPNRERGSWLGEDRKLELDFSGLFARLRKQIPALNIEGAVELADSVYFFHRGNSAGSENAVIRLDRPELSEEIESGRVSDRSLRRITSIKLGSIAGVRLTFGDAAVDPLGRVWFLASAEATDDAYLDGAYRGAILGRLDAGLERVKEIHRIDSPASSSS